MRGAVAGNGKIRREAEKRRCGGAVQVGREGGVENHVEGGGVRR